MPLIHTTRTAKSAKRRLAVTLLSVFAVLGVGGATYLATAAKAPFTLSASPASQTVTAGQNATYVISVNRDSKFSGQVALTASSPHQTITTTFTPNPVPGSSSSATLVVKTNQGGTTPAGTYNLTITGTGGQASASATVSLTVGSASTASFTIGATPSSRLVSENDNAAFAIGISRTNFGGNVQLSVSGLPRGTTGSFVSANANGATLAITTARPKAGTYPLTITGTSGAMTRTAAVNLVVEERRIFKIERAPKAAVTDDLVPGTTLELNLLLTNPQSFPLQVTDLSVSMDPQTSKAGCAGDENYSVDQISGAYPITLPANSSRTLSELGVSDKPTVTMNDLATNQDACKGAELYFRYDGAATK